MNRRIQATYACSVRGLSCRARVRDRAASAADPPCRPARRLTPSDDDGIVGDMFATTRGRAAVSGAAVPDGGRPAEHADTDRLKSIRLRASPLRRTGRSDSSPRLRSAWHPDQSRPEPAHWRVRTMAAVGVSRWTRRERKGPRAERLPACGAGRPLAGTAATRSAHPVRNEGGPEGPPLRSTGGAP
jgi:hypothetical protein